MMAISRFALLHCASLDGVLAGKRSQAEQRAMLGLAQDHTSTRDEAFNTAAERVVAPKRQSERLPAEHCTADGAPHAALLKVPVTNHLDDLTWCDECGAPVIKRTDKDNIYFPEGHFPKPKIQSQVWSCRTCEKHFCDACKTGIGRKYQSRFAKQESAQRIQDQEARADQRERDRRQRDRERLQLQQDREEEEQARKDEVERRAKEAREVQRFVMPAAMSTKAETVI